MSGERPWLLLDLAGVLLDFAPERRLALIGSLSGLPPEMVKLRIDDDGITERIDTGQAAEAELARFLSTLCGRAIDVEEAWKIWLSPFSVARTPMAEIPALKLRFRLGIFTNNPPRITRLLDPSQFDAMFFSSDLGMKKPDPDSYEAVARELAVGGEMLIFIDDGAANVEGARRAGWRAIQYDPASASLLEALETGQGPVRG